MSGLRGQITFWRTWKRPEETYEQYFKKTHTNDSKKEIMYCFGFFLIPEMYWFEGMFFIYHIQWEILLFHVKSVYT